MIGTALYNQLVDVSWIPGLRRFAPDHNIPNSTTTQPTHSHGNIQEGEDSDSEEDLPSERTRLINKNMKSDIDL